MIYSTILTFSLQLKDVVKESRLQRNFVSVLFSTAFKKKIKGQQNKNTKKTVGIKLENCKSYASYHLKNEVTADD